MTSCEDPVIDWARIRGCDRWVDFYDWSKPSLAGCFSNGMTVTVRLAGPHIRAVIETNWGEDMAELGLKPPTDNEWWVWEGTAELRDVGLRAIGSWRRPTFDERRVLVRRLGVPWDELRWQLPNPV